MMRPSERWLVPAVGATLFTDTIFYTALNPLLPHLVRQFHMSTSSAGALTASYAVGCLVGTWPGSLLVTRRGPRSTVVIGLTLIIVSTLAFALLSTTLLLDTARLSEGIGGACAWTGGLAWIVSGTKPDRRGSSIGLALAASTVGSLCGPLVGALAEVAGRRTAFGLVAGLATVLIGVCLRAPGCHRYGQAARGQLRAQLLIAVW